VSLRDAWESQADDWAAWARTPGHDSFWKGHADAFLRLLPPPGRLTLDLGCGEGRLGRLLQDRGHRVVAVDSAPTLARLAARHEQTLAVAVADMAALPVREACADLAVAYMSLQDVDDMLGSVGEAARVLMPSGRLCIAVVHPVNSAGSFEGEDPDSRFVVDGAYLGSFRYADEFERDGLRITFHGLHHPLEEYSAALERAGLLVEAMREPADREDARWQRLPLFLHLRAVRGGGAMIANDDGGSK
jgi:SAM-dependent methyltransferase